MNATYEFSRWKKEEAGVFQALNLFEIENGVINISPIVLTKLPSVAVRVQSENSKQINISNQRI